MPLQKIKSKASWLAAMCVGLIGCFISDATPATAQTQDEKVKVTSSDIPDKATTMSDALALADRIADETDSLVATDMLKQLRAHLVDLQTSVPSDPWLFYLSARILTLTGQRGDAIAQLRLFVKTREGSTAWQAHRDLGDMYVTEFPQLAKASYKKAAQLTANESSVLYGLSRCASKLGHNAEALDYATRATAAEPTIKYWSNVATLSTGEKKWEQAIHASRKALELAKEKAAQGNHAQPSLIIVEAQSKHYIDIIQAKFRALSTIDSANGMRLATLYRDRAELIQQIILYDGLKSLEDMMQSVTDDTWANLAYESAVMLEKLSQTDNAIKRLDEILAKHPNHDQAMALRDRLTKTHSIE